MHRSHKRRFKRELPRAEVLQALAELTARVGQGELVLGDEAVSLDDVIGLKIGLKYVGDACRLKVSLKYPASGLEAPLSGGWTVEAAEAGQDVAKPVETGGKPRYNRLKKRMKQTFKAITTALAAVQFPPADLVAAFIADARLMTAFPGKGDDHYPAFNAEVTRFEEAAAAGDVAAMTASVAALDRMKKECHSRHA